VSRLSSDRNRVIMSSKCSITDSMYDITTVLISIADITTDIWIMYNFYTSGKMVFFWIAFVILLLAQLAYALAFVIRFAWVFVAVLPISPLLSFIIYFASIPNSPLATFMHDKFGLTVEEPKYKPEKTAIENFIYLKFMKHMVCTCLFPSHVYTQVRSVYRVSYWKQW